MTHIIKLLAATLLLAGSSYATLIKSRTDSHNLFDTHSHYRIHFADDSATVHDSVLTLDFDAISPAKQGTVITIDSSHGLFAATEAILTNGEEDLLVWEQRTSDDLAHGSGWSNTERYLLDWDFHGFSDADLAGRTFEKLEISFDEVTQWTNSSNEDILTIGITWSIYGDLNQQQQVPETTATAGLFFAGLAGLALIKRKIS